MPRVTRRLLAAADILDIWDYIAEDSLARRLTAGSNNWMQSSD